jgi:hypothetical protein
VGKTLRIFKGKAYPEKSRRKPKEKKWFGFTYGNHTDKHYVAGSARIEDGQLVKEFETRPPVKGKDFIKSGYPDGLYPKHMVQAKKRGYHEEEI